MRRHRTFRWNARTDGLLEWEDFKDKWASIDLDKKRAKLAEVELEVQKYERLVSAGDSSSSALYDDKLGKAMAKQQFLKEELGMAPVGDRSKVFYGKRALRSSTIEWEPSLQAKLEFADFKDKWAKKAPDKLQARLDEVSAEIEHAAAKVSKAEDDAKRARFVEKRAKLEREAAWLRQALQGQPMTLQVEVAPDTADAQVEGGALPVSYTIDYDNMEEKWGRRTEDQLKEKLRDVQANLEKFETKMEGATEAEKEHYAAKLQKAEIKRTYLQGKLGVALEGSEDAAGSSAAGGDSSGISAVVEGLGTLGVTDVGVNIGASSQEPAAPAPPPQAGYQPQLFGGSLFDQLSSLYDTFGDKNTSELKQIRDRAMLKMEKYEGSLKSQEATAETDQELHRMAHLRAFAEGQLSQRLAKSHQV